MLFGLPRTFVKCSENINNYLINNNKNYEFTIIVSTDLDCKNHSKWENEIDNYKLSKDDLENKLKQVYNIKNITYISGPIYNIYNNKIIMYERLYSLLENEKNNNYDIYIYLRLDCILLQPIYLDHFSNKFSIITRYYGGGGHFHNKDWDFMWLGCNNAFKIWCYNILKKYKDIYTEHYSLINNNYIDNTLDYDTDLDEETFNNISEKYNIVPNVSIFKQYAPTYKYVHLFYKIIKILEDNNLIFEINKNFSQIVR